MTQINASNHASVTGTLANEPRIFKNADNSLTVYTTVGYRLEYTRKGEDKPGFRNVSLQDYIPANEDGSAKTSHRYSNLHQGSLVQVAYEPFDDSYAKNGETVYKSVNSVRAVKFLDTKERAAELAKRAEDKASTKAAESAPAAEQAAPVAQAPATVGAVDPLA